MQLYFCPTWRPLTEASRPLRCESPNRRLSEKIVGVGLAEIVVQAAKVGEDGVNEAQELVGGGLTIGVRAKDFASSRQLHMIQQFGGVLFQDGFDVLGPAGPIAAETVLLKYHVVIIQRR